jgi:glycosyltransferase involved in cell wall biosynthesis
MSTISTAGGPRVTTIIPTYRRPALLLRAIVSALGQSEVSLTVNVFDNASGDETTMLVSELAASDPRLNYHCHERNLGGASNFEYGLRSVTSSFFSILSDDDYLLPGFYQRALDDLAKNPEAMFWVGLTLNVDEQGTIWDARVDRWSREGLFFPPEGLMAMMHGMAPVWTGIVFRREILDSIGFPDQEALGPSDLDFILKAASSHPFILRKYPSAVFTLNSTSFSATQPLSSFWPGWQKMFLNMEANGALDSCSKETALAALHQDARRMLFRRGANALAANRYDFARGAAEVLRAQYGEIGRPLVLKTIATSCERFSWVQRMYAYLYHVVESRLVRSRADLDLRFGDLISRSRRSDND